MVRNRVSHRDFKYAEPKEAFQALMQLDYLTEKLSLVAQKHGKQLT